MEEIEKRKTRQASNDDNDTSPGPETTSKRRRIAGPVLPSSAASLHGSYGNTASESESDSDDDIGPVLPPAGPVLSEIDDADRKPDPSTHEVPMQGSGFQRDKWMLQPPGATDWSSRIDSTKLRSRGFQTGKPGRAAPGGQIDSSWTESPEQKIKRLEDKVLGISGSTVTDSQDHAAQVSRVTELAKARIHKYNEATRKDALPGAPCLSKECENDDPSTRPFDREKDMSTSSRINNHQRRQILDKAADFSSRFAGGKFL
ncbi:hypothetical protein ASPWEDRAFT_46795 [Aspergillus wentii DTO 134E9]|uniref:DUF3752 domain-containing protein n=1 Tax=Aspergillus wentii DTO 134E9 TaxID=1073089 RepID=A0A1L9R586_ASPWE|nr:uncharacterized protein ASPWEDRAFT_46795 [Aspergillus wentii DTO 134E9]OJJ30058.1 hypothetical protein ASPWEDRAFT_46795 [Aspergillus wentii DTO 134E9]